jgi:hypothetical protein
MFSECKTRTVDWRANASQPRLGRRRAVAGSVPAVRCKRLSSNMSPLRVDQLFPNPWVIVILILQRSFRARVQWHVSQCTRTPTVSRHGCTRAPLLGQVFECTANALSRISDRAQRHCWLCCETFGLIRLRGTLFTRDAFPRHPRCGMTGRAHCSTWATRRHRVHGVRSSPRPATGMA